jgi:multidrug efflux pump subunit AcrB
MAINVSSWSIRKPLPSIVLSLVLVILGVVAFGKLPITRLPNVDLPIISVTVAQFGSAPAELEAQVTKAVEDAVSGVENVRNLPQNISEPLIQRVDVVGLPIVTYAAVSPGKTPEQLSYFVDDVVTRAVQGVRGVGRVERIGGVEREILVALDPDLLQAVGLTASDVSRRLRGSNLDMTGGRAEIGGRDQSIRTLAGAKTLEALAGTMISLPRGGEVRLDDLGTVTDTVAAPRTFARLDGQPVVGFSVLRSKGASDVAIASGIEAKLKDVKAAYPDVDMKLIDNSVNYTVGNYHSALSTLFEGAALAVIVVFLFLRDWRATVIAAIALPLSILPAFWVMDTLGFTLNMVSLLAITLSTGILVDDAIVEIENIVRHIRMGKSPYQAALEAADEIGLAVIAISLTIVAVFIPVSFMGSIAGQFFKQFGVTVAVQVLFSLLCARLVTPMLAAYFLAPKHHKEKPPGRLLNFYTSTVALSVRWRYLTVLIGIGLFVGSILSVKLLPSGFLPPQDTGRSLLAIELPAGSQLSDTQAVAEDIVRRLKTRPEIRSVFIDGGRVPPATIETRKASLIINYTPKNERTLSQSALEQAITRDLATVPDIRYWFLDENGLRPVSLIVKGANARAVDSVAAELAAQMRRVPLITNVVAQGALERPELRITPRKDLVARLGISTQALAETIRVATIGDVGPALARFDAGDRLIPIRVQLEESARGDRQTLERLKVPMGGGNGSVPLVAISDIEFGQGPITIFRYDRNRRATIEADLVGGAALGDALAQIRALPVMKGLPPGVGVDEAGDAETMQELFSEFGGAMRDGLMMVFAVLVLLFGSFLQPITILFSLPLSIGGVIGALLLVSKPISMPVIIGILMLMGIVTKNAIMLVDFAIEAMHAGMDRASAIIEACQKRARPIVMTTVAMIAGMAPSALAVGAGGEFRSPMAIAVIGGLLVSTMLSLLFVPAFFALMDDLSRLGLRVLARLSGPTEETPPTAPHVASASQPAAAE